MRHPRNKPKADNTVWSPTTFDEKLCVKKVSTATDGILIENAGIARFLLETFLRPGLWAGAALASILLLVVNAPAQVNVLTGHNDPARDGLNSQETTLTPANVNPTQFGQLFSYPVNGGILAQPLYVSKLALPNQGTHNVVYVATSNDYVYAFDGDTNGGANAQPLWQAALTNTPAGAGLTNVNGVVGTPVIDLGTQTMYLVSSEALSTGIGIYRFHALSITTGAEKFGGPIQIQASVPGTGSGSVNGVLAFNPAYHLQRPSLLFQNGVVYAAFGSVADQGPWHGWIFSFNVNPGTQTLQQVNVFCSTPNGTGGGIWMAGAGPAGEVYSAAKPYGRMFVTTANGTLSLTAPYNYSMNVLDFDLSGGTMTLEDQFTPFNAVQLSSEDADLGSGAPVLLPTQTLASGKTLKPLVQIGKSGMFYILDRDNNVDGSNNAATEYAPAGLGGFNATGDQVVQELQTPIASGENWGAGVWGTEAYWNNNIYSGGLDPSALNSLAAYSFVNGVLSHTPSSTAADLYTYAPPTPSVSSNGNTSGVVWILKTDSYPTIEPEILLAYNATNLADSLYSSNTNPARDNPGAPQNHVVPTIINGKVYVGAANQLSVFGLLGTEPQAAPPTINPASNATAKFPLTVTMGAAAGATIYYATNGTRPNSNSAVYSAANPPVVATNATVMAVASVAGQLQSTPASATYLSLNTPPNPLFSLAPGAYSGTQTLTITDSSAAATIYYTIDGSTPSPNVGTTAVFSQALSVSVSETVNAVAIAAGNLVSGISAASYTITPIYTIDFSQGFAAAEGPMIFNGSTDVDDVRLQLTNGGTNQAGSAFYATPVNIQAFTTQFTFQLSNPAADGITFTIQNAGPLAIGGYGALLGYGGIQNSLAIKFDLYSNAGEGPNSTGLYVDGAVPTIPAIDLTASGINLHSGDFINATITYNGANLTLTLTDAITLATYSTSFMINIPATVGGNTAYVGFTGGTGGLSSSQKILTWTYLTGAPTPNYPNGFNSATGLIFNGNAGGQASLNGTRLRLTDGGIYEARSAYFGTELNIQQFTTSFNFQFTNATADGFTFVIQGASPNAVGGFGGSLGYAGILESIAVKFDLFNNAGEGLNSTGVYINGALPELPAINLTGTGINLQAGGANGIGDVFHVQIAYNGTTLTVVITDTVTQGTATQTYTVNIPGIVGGPTAWVGFTGGTGGGTAVQDIINWTYNLAPVAAPAFAGGFPTTAASQITLNGGAVINNTALRLTDGNPNETRSAFFTAPVNVQQFTTGFAYHPAFASADGMTFTIQGNSPTALGAAGGGLGYAGIPNSVAIKLDLYSNSGEGIDSTGMYTNGSGPGIPAINLTPFGVNLHNQDTFDVQMSYNGTSLTVVIVDTVTNAIATQSYTVNIPALVGGPTAYVGFTGASGGLTAIQDVLNWTYTPGPPATPSFGQGFAAVGSQLSLNGGAVLNGTALELTDGGNTEARSAFYTTPVNIQQFVTSFNFQLINPNADGFTFAIQGINPTVVGGNGGALGFSGLSHSLAVKFDLYNNAGEGPDSTGLYTNGAAPTVPAVNLAGTGINLHSGDVFNAGFVYNGSTLTVVITDTVTNATATQTYTVNIPGVVGGNTAYVGFTAGTGGATSTQEILNWNYYAAGNL